MNIHPSLLPLYPGLNTHQKVINNKDKKHGISIHYVSSELDAGPLIAQAAFDIKEINTKELLEEKIHIIEHSMFPFVIENICLENIRWNKKLKKVIFRNMGTINDSIQRKYEI